jgi:hypothetical protein
MKMAGFSWLVTGWAIVLAAVVLLQAATQGGFVLAGFCVQAVGLTQIIRSHLPPPADKAGDKSGEKV